MRRCVGLPGRGGETVLEIDCSHSRDMCCVTCAYSLRGLPEDGVCPECRTPIAVSMANEAFWSSDPEWVTRLSRGAALLWASFVVIICTDIGMACLESIPRSGFSTRAFALVEGVRILLTAGACLGVCSMSGGIWLLSSPRRNGGGRGNGSLSACVAGGH